MLPSHTSPHRFPSYPGTLTERLNSFPPNNNICIVRGKVIKARSRGDTLNPNKTIRLCQHSSRRRFSRGEDVGWTCPEGGVNPGIPGVKRRVARETSITREFTTEEREKSRAHEIHGENFEPLHRPSVSFSLVHSRAQLFYDLLWITRFVSHRGGTVISCSVNSI